jgi:hypothetical protein
LSVVEEGYCFVERISDYAEFKVRLPFGRPEPIADFSGRHMVSPRGIPSIGASISDNSRLRNPLLSTMGKLPLVLWWDTIRLK